MTASAEHTHAEGSQSSAAGAFVVVRRRVAGFLGASSVAAEAGSLVAAVLVALEVVDFEVDAFAGAFAAVLVVLGFGAAAAVAAVFVDALVVRGRAAGFSTGAADSSPELALKAADGASTLGVEAGR